MDIMKVGIVGVGDISGIYLQNITQVFKNIEVIGVCDLVEEKAIRAVEKYNIPKLYKDMYELFADDEVDIVLNLTRPYEHYGVSIEALKAGKHVYSEKPLAATIEQGKELVKLAEEKGLFLGGAPDTFLGAGIQTCRKLIDSGFIGKPLGAAAFMICHGHESWHPDPEFYYKHGGGPMMDMGPYYVTALINLLGGVKSVAGMTKASFPTRTITSEPLNGKKIEVDVPTYVLGLMEFDSGVTASIFTTFDVYYDTQARLEIYGSEGTLIVPDPNGFGGPIKLLRPEEGVYKEIPLMFNYSENSRALGLSDCANSIMKSCNPRTSYKQTYHVLEVMESFEKSSRERRFVDIESKFERERPMSNNLLKGCID